MLTPCSDVTWAVSKTTSDSTICLTVCSGHHKMTHQSSVILTYCEKKPWWALDSPHKGSVMRKAFPCHKSSWKTSKLNNHKASFVAVSTNVDDFFSILFNRLLLIKEIISGSNSELIPKSYLIYINYEDTCQDVYALLDREVFNYIVMSPRIPYTWPRVKPLLYI